MEIELKTRENKEAVNMKDRKKAIQSSYRQLGDIGTVYDGIITRSTLIGKIIDSAVWGLDKTLAEFGYQEIEGEQSSQDMGADETTQRWWDYMKDIMETNPDNSPVTIPIQEVFHLD